MNRDIEMFYSVIESARSFMNQMNDLVADIHREMGINSGSRGVLLLLKQHGSMTSPQLVREMTVSRQYLQKAISQMIKRNLVEQKNNPTHKKSSFLKLTLEGERTLAKLLNAESKLLQSKSLGVSENDMVVTTQTLHELTNNFKK